MPAFTTSRKPCARVRTFVKDLARVIPESVTISRGKRAIDDIAEEARRAGYSRVAVITEMHGNPHSVRVLEVSESDWEWLPKSFVIKGVKLCREFSIPARRTNKLKTDDKIGFAKALGVESGESDTVLKADKTVITFIQAGKEVGPRLVLKEIRDELAR